MFIVPVVTIRLSPNVVVPDDVVRFRIVKPLVVNVPVALKVMPVPKFAPRFTFPFGFIGRPPVNVPVKPELLKVEQTPPTAITVTTPPPLLLSKKTASPVPGILAPPPPPEVVDQLAVLLLSQVFVPPTQNRDAILCGCYATPFTRC